jgi:2-oxoacid:acceptor oxidoreductase gamma subunit (pyruvate/2-ketoisovalerate family)
MEHDLTEFRLHGRGGQGIVIASAIFAEAVSCSSLHARAFSLFGAERRGAPVTSFIRAGRNIVMPRSKVYNPGNVIVFDASIDKETMLEGLKNKGIVLLNSSSSGIDDFIRTLRAGLEQKQARLFYIDAGDIAWRNNLTSGSIPMINTVMLGAMARVSGLVQLKDLIKVIEKKITASVEANLKAAIQGYEDVREVENFGFAGN